jgi:regulator of ribonuclease activity A
MKTSDLCDALESVHACKTQFRGFGRRRAFAGPVRTVHCDEDIGEIRRLLNEPGRGCVLVVDGGGSLGRALIGDNMAALMIRNGWAGAIVFGAARDVAEIDGMDVGIKALGTVSRRGERNGAGECDVAVSFGGVTFVPGAYVVADEDGVVVLPLGVTPSDVDLSATSSTY